MTTNFWLYKNKKHDSRLDILFLFFIWFLHYC